MHFGSLPPRGVQSSGRSHVSRKPTARVILPMRMTSGRNVSITRLPVQAPTGGGLSGPGGSALDLPRRLDHQGVMGVEFAYQLVRSVTHLQRTENLEGQGVREGDVLWLEVKVKPFVVGRAHLRRARPGDRPRGRPKRPRRRADSPEGSCERRDGDGLLRTARRDEVASRRKCPMGLALAVRPWQ